MKYASLNDTVYFFFSVNNTAGSGTHGDTTGTGTIPGEAQFYVRCAQDPITAPPTYRWWAQGLDSTYGLYPPGCYQVTVPATGANGFIAGNTYAVFASLFVSVQNPTGFVGEFTLAPVQANVLQSLGTPVTNEDGTMASATPTTITFPNFDSAGNVIPDQDQYDYCVLQIVGGTGVNQFVLTTTAVPFITGTGGAEAREYNVLAGTMPTTLDNTSKYVIRGKWKTNSIYWDNSPIVTPNVTGIPVVDIGYCGGQLATSTNGFLGADVRMFIGTAITQGSGGQLAGTFTHFFDVPTPTGTVNSLPAYSPNVANGLPIITLQQPGNVPILNYQIPNVQNVIGIGSNGITGLTLSSSALTAIAGSLTGSAINSAYTVMDLFKDLACTEGGQVTGGGITYTMPTATWGSAHTQIAVSGTGGDRSYVRS
jgi:hypothetical protein